MTNQAIARSLLVALCSLQGLATAVIDLNRTHATNPQWPGHARFHLVWQTAASVWMALFEVVLILAPGPCQEQRFYLAAILAGIPMLGFFSALIGRRLYKGKLHDPNGMKPVTIRVGGTVLGIDLNLVAEILGVLALTAIIAIYRHASG